MPQRSARGLLYQLLAAAADRGGSARGSAGSLLQGLCSSAVCRHRPLSYSSTHWCRILLIACCCAARAEHCTHGSPACSRKPTPTWQKEGAARCLWLTISPSGRFDKAVRYSRRAGRQSVARSGFVEAITQLRTGLRLIHNLLDTHECKQQELELQIALAGALTVVKGYAHPEVVEAFGRARSLISETGQAGEVVHFSMLRGLWAAELAATQGPRSTTLTNSYRLPNLREILGCSTGHWLVGRVLIAIGDYPAATSQLDRQRGHRGRRASAV